MSSDNAKWLDEANKKFESCVYSCKRGLGGGCVLDGYPILDCPRCNSYKENKIKKEEK